MKVKEWVHNYQLYICLIPRPCLLVNNAHIAYLGSTYHKSDILMSVINLCEFVKMCLLINLCNFYRCFLVLVLYALIVIYDMMKFLWLCDLRSTCVIDMNKISPVKVWIISLYVCLQYLSRQDDWHDFFWQSMWA